MAIMVGVVALLGAGVLAEQVREARFGPRTFLDLNERSISQIERQCSGCAPLTLIKRQGTWELVKPYVAPASADAVERVVDIAAAPVRHRYKPGGPDEASWGFDPPFATLKLGERTILFGAATPAKDRYVRSGDRVALVQDRFAALLTAPPEEFVTKRVLRGKPVGATVMMQPMTPEQVAAFETLEADRVVPAPLTIAAHAIDVTYADGRTDTYLFEVRPNELAALRRGDRFMYLIGPEKAESIGIDVVD